MKRVFLLVLLIVSLVELDWERGRIYLFSSLTSLSLVIWTELLRGRRMQKATTTGALRTGQAVSSQACLAYVPLPPDRAHQLERIEPSAALDMGLSCSASVRR